MKPLHRLVFALVVLIVTTITVHAEPVVNLLASLNISSSEAITTASLVGVMPMTGRMRAVYDYILSLLPDTYDRQLITTSYLRSQKLISNSSPVYDFEILKGNDSPLATERRLDKNDVFVVTHLGFYLVQNPVDTGVEQLNGILQTYNNPTALAGSANIPDLAAFWNGSWSIKVGSTVFFDAYPNQLTWAAPDTQQSSATTRSSRAYADGAPIVEPMPVLSGANTNVVQLTIPFWTGFAGADTDVTATKTYAVFHPYGFLVKNAANTLRQFNN